MSPPELLAKPEDQSSTAAPPPQPEETTDNSIPKPDHAAPEDSQHVTPAAPDDGHGEKETGSPANGPAETVENGAKESDGSVKPSVAQMKGLSISTPATASANTQSPDRVRSPSPPPPPAKDEKYLMPKQDTPSAPQSPISPGFALQDYEAAAFSEKDDGTNPVGASEDSRSEIQSIMDQFGEGVEGPGMEEIMSPRLEKANPMLVSHKPSHLADPAFCRQMPHLPLLREALKRHPYLRSYSHPYPQDSPPTRHFRVLRRTRLQLPAQPLRILIRSTSLRPQSLIQSLIYRSISTDFSSSFVIELRIRLRSSSGPSCTNLERSNGWFMSRSKS